MKTLIIIQGLKELEIGDIFYNVKGQSKNPPLFVVRGAAVFNQRHGSPTRMCHAVKTKTMESKSCRISVVKVGESKFKEQYKLKPINKI